MADRDSTTAALVVAPLVLGPFLLGSAPRWAAMVTAVLCLAAAVPLLNARRGFQVRPHLLAFLGLAVAITAVQLIPLPRGLVSLLSPGKNDLLLQHAAAWGSEPPAFTPLTYDYPATLVELAKFAGYVAFAIACLWVATRERGRRQLLTTVALVGTSLAVVAVAHKLVGARVLFGVYQPNFRAPEYLAPLLNPNHMAGYMALVVPVTIGLAAGAPARMRLAWLAAALVCASIGLLTESRGGVIAMFAGSAVAGALLWLQYRRGDRESDLPRSVLIPGIIVVACAVTLLIAFTAGPVTEELRQTTTDELTSRDFKLAAWTDSMELLDDHRWTGVGRGAFEFAFTRVHPTGRKTYSHVENEYVQMVLDWGLPAAALLAVFMVLAILRATRRSMAGPLAAGALGGLVAVGMHNVVDFNLELPGVAVAALAVLATVTPVSLRARERTPVRMRMRVGALAAGLAVVALAASPLGATASGEAEELKEDAAALPAGDLVDDAEALSSRHPSDYLTAGIAAEILARAGDGRAPRVVNYALALNPAHSGLHLLAAQILSSSAVALEERAKTEPAEEAKKHRADAAQARKQALVEYALSLSTAEDPRLPLQDMLRRYQDVDTVVAGLPTDPVLAVTIDEALSILGRSDIALAHASRVREAVPHDPTIAALVARFALERNDSRLALAAAEFAYQQQGDAAKTLLYARALAANRAYDRAESLLTQAIARTRSRGTRKELIALVVFLGEVQILMDKLDEAEMTLMGARDMSPDRVAAAAVHRHLAVIKSRQGLVNQAAAEMALAERLDPSPAVPIDAGVDGGTRADAGVDGGNLPDAGQSR